MVAVTPSFVAVFALWTGTEAGSENLRRVRGWLGRPAGEALNKERRMQEQQNQFQIRFEGVSADVSGKMADKLRQELIRISSDVDVRQIKDDRTTQDFGTTIVLILGTPAVLAIANGIAAYLKRDRATISIISSDGKVVATGVSGADTVRIAEALGQSKPDK